MAVRSVSEKDALRQINQINYGVLTSENSNLYGQCTSLAFRCENMAADTRQKGRQQETNTQGEWDSLT